MKTKCHGNPNPNSIILLVELEDVLAARMSFFQFCSLCTGGLKGQIELMESWVLLGHRYVVFLVFNYVDSHLSNTGRFFHHMCVSLSDDHIGFTV